MEASPKLKPRPFDRRLNKDHDDSTPVRRGIEDRGTFRLERQASLRFKSGIRAQLEEGG